MSPSRARLWRSAAPRLALAVLPVWITVAVLVFNTPWRTKLLVGGVFGLSLASPAHGLLAVAAIAPFGHVIAAALRLDPFRVSESLVLAFLGAWLIRGRNAPVLPRTVALACSLLTAVVCASIAAQAWRATERPGDLAAAARIVFQAYYLVPDAIGLQAGARLVEGIGLLAAVHALFRTKPRLAATLPAVIVVSATVAAATSFLVTRGIAPAQILEEYARHLPRVSAHVGDVNAAASYFGMAAIVALGLAARTRSVAALGWIAAAAALAWALWISGSRTGAFTAAVACGGAMAVAFAARRRPAVRSVVLVVAVAAAIAAGVVRARTLRADAAAGFRRDFNATSVRMIAARPIAGVGIGQYYDASPLFLSPFLAWFYGFENAHNYFLQLAAETGIVGLAAFTLLAATVLATAAAGYFRAPDDWRLLGCAAGAAALLATCLAGHPLLIDEVAYPFWIVLGLVGALGLSAARIAPQRSERSFVWIAAALLVGVYIAAGRAPLKPSESIGATGLEGWESDAGGARFRWTHEYASVFVPRGATRVYLPVRQPIDVPQLAGLGVEVHAAGVPKGRTIVGPTWAILNVELPPIATRQLFRRVDFKVDRTWQPALYIPGSGDLRKIGVQVGEPKIFFEY